MFHRASIRICISSSGHCLHQMYIRLVKKMVAGQLYQRNKILFSGAHIHVSYRCEGCKYLIIIRNRYLLNNWNCLEFAQNWKHCKYLNHGERLSWSVRFGNFEKTFSFIQRHFTKYVHAFISFRILNNISSYVVHLFCWMKVGTIFRYF